MLAAEEKADKNGFFYIFISSIGVGIIIAFSH